MIFFRVFLIFIVQLVFARSEKNNIEPEELYKLLENSKGWVINDEIEGEYFLCLAQNFLV